MSTDFRSAKPIKLADLFDGRQERFGVRKYISEELTPKNGRALTDGENYLWVWPSANGQYMGSYTRFGSNDANHILWAIAETFDTDITTEHEAEYWDFEPRQKWSPGESNSIKNSRT